MRDITIGQYYPTDSVLHKLDPRVKLVGTFAFLVSLFVGNGIVAYAIATVFLAAVIKLSKVPFKMIIKGLKAAGKTIILITHKLEEIKKVADRCAILCKGKLIAGSIQQLNIL